MLLEAGVPFCPRHIQSPPAPFSPLNMVIIIGIFKSLCMVLLSQELPRAPWCQSFQHTYPGQPSDPKQPAFFISL